jgi:hypothetical protein
MRRWWSGVTALVMIGALLTPAAAGAQTAAAAATEQADEQRPLARQALGALAALAGLPPRDLIAQARALGGLRPALAVHGVSEQRIMETLIRLQRARLDEAVAEGRLSPAQADQVARQEARRMLRRIERLMPPAPAAP